MLWQWFRLVVLLACLLGLLSHAGYAHDEPPCGLEAPCIVQGGSYRVSAPSTLDMPLPVVFFYHGHGVSAETVMDNKPLLKAFDDAGFLLIVMDAQHGFWGHQAARKYSRDDFAYTRAVMADVRRRWQVDERIVVAAGFSNGASMVWDLACHDGGLFKAYVAIAGEFWKPMPKDCEDRPIDLLHIHGLTDPLVPIEGYQFKRGSALLGLFPSFAVFKRIDGCAMAPDSYAAGRKFVLRRWDACNNGGHLAMALHSGGHVMPAGWVELAKAWLDEVLSSMPGTGQRVQFSQRP